MCSKRILSVSAFCLMSLLAAGCASSAPLVDEDYAGIDETVAILCSCWGDYRTSSEAACRALIYSEPSETKLQCRKDAYALDEAASIATLDCGIAARRDLNTCLGLKLICGDFLSDRTCWRNYTDALDACPDLPGKVRDALDACP